MADLLLFINIITCKYYAFSWEIHTHTHAHINKLPSTMTAGDKQKQLLNEWSEWQESRENKRNELKGETGGGVGLP